MSSPILKVRDVDNTDTENNNIVIADNIHIPEEQEIEVVTHTINIPQGWSYISTYIDVDSLPSKDVSSILLPIHQAGKMIIAKNYLGNVWLPEYNFNGIGDWINGQAYQIKLTAPHTLELTGQRLTVTTSDGTFYGMEIPLQGGWNLFGVPTIGTYNTVTVLEHLIVSSPTNVQTGSTLPLFNPPDCHTGLMTLGPAYNTNCGYGAIVTAKDYLGAAYLPEWNFNGIGNLQAGWGYQIKLDGGPSNQYKLIYTESSLGVDHVFVGNPAITDDLEG
tara:strand:- start:18 stop:842 length:825 start_codon:yes stop_codon:yes gene_type:complete